MNIRNIAEAESRLNAYIPNGVRYSGDNMTLKRMWPLLNAVGNPHEKLKVIHVAGTSGKTSTCYYISALLKSTGAKVGLTVSPHVDKITERIQINGSPISDDKFCSLLEEFLEMIDDAQHPSYFELLIVFMYWVFAREQVDYAVIETGMGGLLDGTNVANRADKLCVITDIGFDHMQYLGDTIESIAAQKAGIIHDGNQVFMYEQSPEIMEQIEERVLEKNAKLTTVKQPEIATKSQLALFQQRNFNLAKEVFNYIKQRDNLTSTNLVNPVEVVIPARMERVILKDNTVLIMDGAHNGQKIATFVKSYRDIYQGEKAVIMLALKKGKEFKEVIDELHQIAEKIIITTFSISQDLPAVSQNPEIIGEYCKQNNIDFLVVHNQETALKELLKSNSNMLIITGSFYLLGQIRQYMVR